MAKGMKDKFDKGEGVDASAEDSAPKGEGKRHKKRSKKSRKYKGRG